MKMWAFSSSIREKPRWWEKMKDPRFIAKWRKEALGQDSDSESEDVEAEEIGEEDTDAFLPGRKLSEQMARIGSSRILSF
jgi:hypothetical protein